MKYLRVFLVVFVLSAVTFLVIAPKSAVSESSSKANPGSVVSAAGQTTWWNTDWEYRVPLTVNPGADARLDKPAEVNLNFTTLLASLGQSGSLDLNSIRVIEVDGGDNVIDAAVPFQFDQVDGFDAASNAAGNLIWLLEGNTAANTNRLYHVYFDVTGKGFAPADVTPLITATDNVSHKGYDSIQLVTANAEYFYHKPGGGFATLLDANDNDWLGWNSSTTPSGAAGDFRGIPNMVYPSDGGYFHPGRNTATTSLLRQGPLKVSFASTSDNGQWTILWEVFPSYARMTVIQAPAEINYWFLYEGTPGGALEPSVDKLTRSDGSSILASETWTTDIPNEEWIYVTDPNVGRSLYLVHHTDDAFVDGYFDLDDLMTVFGFGRSGSGRFLSGAGRQFTFGLVNSTDFNSIKTVIYNDWKSLGISVGSAEFNPIEPTPTPTATIEPSPTSSATPTPTATATDIPPTPTATPIPVQEVMLPAILR